MSDLTFKVAEHSKHCKVCGIFTPYIIDGGESICSKKCLNDYYGMLLNELDVDDIRIPEKGENIGKSVKPCMDDLGDGVISVFCSECGSNFLKDSWRNGTLRYLKKTYKVCFHCEGEFEWDNLQHIKDKM